LTLSIRQALGKSEKPWLLIFDNVEKWDDISRYIPRSLPKTKGSVLITTREQDLIQADTPAMHEVLHRHNLEPLTAEESAQFLLRSTNPRLTLDEVRPTPNTNAPSRRRPRLNGCRWRSS